MSGKYVGNTAVAARADLDALWNTTVTGIVTGQIATLQAQMATAQADITTINTSITTINANLSTVNGEITTLFADIATINGEITSILANIATLFADIATINGEITTIDATLASLQAQITANLAAALSNPMTHQGDLIAGGVPVAGVAPPVRLAVDLIGKILVLEGTPPVPQWLYLNLASLISAGGGPVPVKRVPYVYSTAGAVNHTVSAGVTEVEIEAWGAGGGNNSTGSAASPVWCAGGGGGAYGWARKTVAPADTIALVVGAGGVANTNGGDSTVNVTDLVAGGGQGSKDAGAGTATPGGVASATLANPILLPGSTGDLSYSENAAVAGQLFISRGGDSPRGGKGARLFLTSSDPVVSETDGLAPGGGGAGSPYSSTTNFDGKDGQIIVWEFQ